MGVWLVYLCMYVQIAGTSTHADTAHGKIHFRKHGPAPSFPWKRGQNIFLRLRRALPLAVSGTMCGGPEKVFLDSSRSALSFGEVSEVFIEKWKSYDLFLTMPFQNGNYWRKMEKMLSLGCPRRGVDFWIPGVHPWSWHKVALVWAMLRGAPSLAQGIKKVGKLWEGH